MAEDQDGELYGLRYLNGRIFKFIQAGGSANNTIADRLSNTGCVDPADATTVAEGLIPYQTAATFWSDGASKERYYAIPDTSTIDVGPDGDWLFPIGTVLLKHFKLGGSFIETRLFMRHTNGEWAGYTYEWDESQTDATRVVGGKTRDIDGQTWIYPSEAQCVACHTDAASSSLGIEHAQLNKAIVYPSTGVKANQLLTAVSIGVLTDPLTDSPVNLPALADPGDIKKPLDARVRAYLHVNCSGCHRPLGPTPSAMDLRFDTPWADMNVCDVPPTQGTLGIPDARIVAPGDASRSILVNRIGRRDVYGMPPVASNLVDAGGVDLLTTWIDGLPACP